MLKIKEDVINILNQLETSGYKAYCVGGCVRDLLMGNIPKDWDICTSALPSEVANCFNSEKVLETGLKHGTVTLIYNEGLYEITTFRLDGNYTDSRHPDSVEFVLSLDEDLKRRDFTMNAMAYNPKHGLIDLFGGKNDIKNSIIKCVGNPKERFNEDALRILRALRFAARFNFDLDENTARAINKQKNLLNSIAYERIYSELEFILLADHAEGVLLNYKEVFAQIMPEIEPAFNFNQHNPYHSYDVWTHIVKSVVAAPKDIVIKLTMLLHDVGKPQSFTMDENKQGHFYGHAKVSVNKAKDILERLRVSNKTKSEVLKLVEMHDVIINPSKRSVKRLLINMGEPLFRKLLVVKRCDAMAQNPSILKERLMLIDNIQEILETVLAEEQCLSLKDLKVNGNDIILLGVPKGKKIGDILKLLFSMVIEEQVENDKTKLLEKTQEIINTNNKTNLFY